MYRSMAVRVSLMSTLFIIVGACAKISTPSGGMRDRIPPVVVKCIPEYGNKKFQREECNGHI